MIRERFPRPKVTTVSVAVCGAHETVREVRRGQRTGFRHDFYGGAGTQDSTGRGTKRAFRKDEVL